MSNYKDPCDDYLFNEKLARHQKTIEWLKTKTDPSLDELAVLEAYQRIGAEAFDLYKQMLKIGGINNGIKEAEDSLANLNHELDNRENAEKAIIKHFVDKYSWFITNIESVLNRYTNFPNCYIKFDNETIPSLDDLINKVQDYECKVKNIIYADERIKEYDERIKEYKDKKALLERIKEDWDITSFSQVGKQCSWFAKHPYQRIIIDFGGKKYVCNQIQSQDDFSFLVVGKEIESNGTTNQQNNDRHD